MNDLDGRVTFSEKHRPKNIIFGTTSTENNHFQNSTISTMWEMSLSGKVLFRLEKHECSRRNTAGDGKLLVL